LSDLTVLAIDLGGSHVTCAVVRGETILAVKNLAVRAGSNLEPLLPVLVQTMTELSRTVGIGLADCSAVVLGFCGIINARERRVLATNAKFDDAPRLDLNRWCEQEFRLPFLLENDARLALLGEYRCGAARGSADAVMITLGSGVGGAALLDGRLLQSRHGLAGTLGGHMPVVVDGRLCSCGNLGCAEAEASTVSLPDVYRQQAGEAAGLLANRVRFGFAELFEAMDRQDQPAVSTFARCLDVWSLLTIALIHAYDPEVVIFGGSVMKRAAQIIPPIQRYVNAHAWTPGRKVPLRLAVHGSDAALFGAIQLAEAGL
jgi:glucokinase